ncbi:prepilin-type N-terminal cleavage/methylation domain-containing protein [Candidatus Saccharibacteria bacterium TM7i]|nr:prepilin-type N-terminal cleavage/methylation domain-containing protein [Candidatus Saccharibacteria bacterium TM7i]
MSLADIKLNTAKRGFTIVELLIVVVVIAILAAITIVSYNGITNRANASASLSLANTWKKKIELFQAETGSYPYAIASFGTDTSKAYYIDNSSTITGVPATVVTKDNGTKRINLQACGKSSTAASDDASTGGVIISYWQYDKSPNAGLTTISVGTPGSSCANMAGQAS